MESTLGARVREILEQGGGEGEPRFLPLITLESGARYGLDAELRWILAPGEGGAAQPTTPGTVHLLHEAIEHKRDAFDDAIEAGARALGLPASDAAFAFPSVALVRAVLAKQSPYLTRLALLWLRPSELRELREEIVFATTDPKMPGPVKDLARRLVVAG